MPDALAPQVVIVSDGKRGHENQSRVLTRIIGDPIPLTMYLRAGLSEWPLRLRLGLQGAGWLSPPRALRLVEVMLKPESADALRSFAQEIREARLSGVRSPLFTVSTGTPPATLNLVLSRLLGARSIVNMSPSLLPRHRFDLCVVPAHDMSGPLRANTVVTPLALGYHDSPSAQFLAGQLAREHELDRQQRYLALAVGGPSQSFPWDEKHVVQLLAGVLASARTDGCLLLVTTSRRTPAWCVRWLEEHYLADPAVPYFLDAARDPLNPLPAFYELAERVLVTADSYSMVCEAVHAGHCPLVLLPAAIGRPGKLLRSLTRLEEQGLISLCVDPARLGGLLSQPAPRREPNQEYDRLRTEVRSRLGLDTPTAASSTRA